MAEHYVSASASGGNGSSGSPWTVAEANTNATAGDTIYALPGTYSGIGQVFSKQLFWIGVSAAPGADNYATTPTAVFDANFGYVQPFSVSTAGVLFHGITFKNTAANASASLFNVGTTSHHTRFIRCRFTGSGKDCIQHITADSLTCIGCEFDTWGQTATGSAISVTTCIAPNFIGNMFRDGTGIGINQSGVSQGVYARNIFDTLTGAAIDEANTLDRRAAFLTNNTFYNCAYGWRWGTTGVRAVVSMGNYFHTITGDAFALNGATTPVLTTITDKFYNCGGTIASGIIAFEPFSDSDLSLFDGITSPANGDFTIISQTDYALTDTANPYYYLRSGSLTSWRSYLDVGAVDRGERPGTTFTFRQEGARHYA